VWNTAGSSSTIRTSSKFAATVDMSLEDFRQQFEYLIEHEGHLFVDWRGKRGESRKQVNSSAIAYMLRGSRRH